MLKALLKKEFSELLSGFFISRKTGKKRTFAALIGFALLFAYVIGTFVFLFWEYAGTLCQPLVQGGLAWVYFALSGTVATAIGVMLTLFSSFTRLYKAKDNESLLSMPIPPWMIVFSRVIGLYAMAFLFESLVFLPVIVRYFTVAKITAVSLFASCSTLFLLPLLAVSLSGLLGFFISWISVKLPAKNIVTTVFAIGFLLLYFWGYSKINAALQYVLMNGEKVGGVMQKWLFPFWKLGLACEGKGNGFLWTVFLFIGTFALVCLLVVKTFLYLATKKEKVARTKYRSEMRKKRSVCFTLIKRDFLRIVKNPMLFLNCALGSVFLLILPIVVLFKADLLETLSNVFADKNIFLIPLLLGGIASVVIYTSASVSLEGESLWIVRSSPIATGEVFKAKILLQMLATALPSLFCGVTLGILMELSVWKLLLCLVTGVAFCFLFALLGLCVNLKFPNLHWTNELVPVKQGVAALLSMFLNFGVVLLLVGGYFLFGKYMPAIGYLALALLLTIAGTVGCLIWLKKRGEKLFEEL